jgi:LysM repeat protein
MKKTVITTLLVLLFLPLGAQNTVPPQITISTEKVNIGGNIYLIHKVESGETIYSLCRAYKVESEELFKANPQLKEGLKAGKIIYIPTSAKAEISQPNAPIQSAEEEQKKIEKEPESLEQEVPEKDYVEHRVKLFETLNSISRKYNVSVREIMEFNELESSFISFRQILRIPIKKESEKPEEELEDEEKVVEEIGNDIPEGIPFEQMSDTEALARIKLLKGLTHFDRRNPIKIALILPFDTHTSTPSTNYLDFYSGALMAVEKVKEAGLHIALNTIDISAYSWLGEIFQNNMIKDCNLVVGHIDANQINTFTDYCSYNKIPFVSPLDLQTDSLAFHNRYFFQMPVTAATQTKNLIGRINLGDNSKLTIFSDASGSEETYRRSILAAIDSAGLPRNEIRYHIVSGRTIIDSLITTMSPDVEHHIVVASEQEAFASDVIRNMGVLKFHGYNIKLYCSNRIRNFETIEGNLLHEVNAHISTNYFVDYGDKATKEFILGYRALFKTEPTPFAFHGYDTFLYFITVINDLGKDFSNLIYYCPMNMLQNDIHFRRTGPDGGFVNIDSRDLEYTPDSRITVK